ncbi:MAG: hypothetical protein M1376_11550 [Planctomycetes bacterium]|nr:hypothetical protein [Planctomycetota bacterium]
MKLSHSTVSIIAIGAALVSAYAIGLVIRQVRTGARSAAPAAAETTDVAARRPGPQGTPSQDTPAERAQVKQKKAQTLETMSAATKQEQEQFKDKVIRQVGGRRGGQVPGGLTPEERRARKMKAEGPFPAGGQTHDANAPIAPKESTDLQQSAEKAGGTP